MTRLPMFEFAGGGPAFMALATVLHQRCLEDPVLSHPFSHPGNPEHVERLADYWGEVFGGPPRYSESFGGQSGMLGIHAGQGADDDLGERFAACFVQAADDAALPDDPDFRAVLRSRVGTSEVGPGDSSRPQTSSLCTAFTGAALPCSQIARPPTGVFAWGTEPNGGRVIEPAGS